ncbi:hypothetical protein SDC9_192058 [bioreactor metagenome]|uniref:Uncharacterized protein n=1 Tax=bioreactor metagenome TaxID=1076179 RepID=A0A645IAN5_9ZZZZ
MNAERIGIIEPRLGIGRRFNRLGTFTVSEVLGSVFIDPFQMVFSRITVVVTTQLVPKRDIGPVYTVFG